jgi:polysaccharide export outer membrane protein
MRTLIRGLINCMALILVLVLHCITQPIRVSAQVLAGVQAGELLAGPGDILHVSVYGEPELEQRIAVSGDGVARIYILGDVKVDGLTVNQIETKLESEYKAHAMLYQASVNVTIEQSATMQVSVFGEVHNPGTYDVNTSRPVTNVLAMAGGLNDSADRRILIRHRDGSEVVAFVTNSPANPAYMSALVYPGDTVVVSKAGIIYVLGDVNRPGGYTMQRDSALSALQAVAMAGGLLPNAAAPHARIVRKQASNPKGYVDIPLELRAMQKGAISDMPLQADDVIYVPFSYTRNFIIQSPVILASATSAIIYTHP